MQNFSEFIADREIISDNDISDDYMNDEQEEMKIKHFNSSKKWMGMILYHVDLIEEENGDLLKDAFLFAEKYTPELFKEVFTTKAAALATGINVRTAQNYVQTYNNDPERRLPGFYSEPRGKPRAKLTEEHSEFLVDYTEKNTTAILDVLKLKLCEKFEGLRISISAIHRHLVHKYNITFKKLEKKHQQQEILTE